MICSIVLTTLGQIADTMSLYRQRIAGRAGISGSISAGIGSGANSDRSGGGDAGRKSTSSLLGLAVGEAGAATVIEMLEEEEGPTRKGSLTW